MLYRVCSLAVVIGWSAIAGAGQQTVTADRDAFVISSQTGNNGGGAAHLYVGTAGASAGSGAVHSFVHLPMPSLSPPLDNRVTVTRVRLRLFGMGRGTSYTLAQTAGTLTLWPVISAWNEGTGSSGSVTGIAGTACGSAGNGATWASPTCSGGGWNFFSSVATTTISAVVAASAIFCRDRSPAM